MSKRNKKILETPFDGCGCICGILILSAVLLRIGYGLEGLGVSRGVVASIFIVILIANIIGIPIVVITIVVKALKNRTKSKEEWGKRTEKFEKESVITTGEDKTESEEEEEGLEDFKKELAEALKNDLVYIFDEYVKEMVEEFKKVIDCPYRYYDNGASDELLKDFNESLERGKREGFIPIIIYVNDSMLMDIEYNDESNDKIDIDEIVIEKIRTMRKELIDNASSYEGKRWLDEMLKEYQEDSEHYQKILGVPSDKGDEIHKLNPEEKHILLAEVPVSEPWQLFAWFPFSYYNNCPDNKTLANVGKYWFEQYGAVPTFIAHNMLGMTVPQPVSDAQSLNLAKEQCAFCLDIVEDTEMQTIQQTIHALADSLRKSTVWNFRWEY